MRGRDANPAVKEREAVRHVLEKSCASSCGDCIYKLPQASTPVNSIADQCSNSAFKIFNTIVCDCGGLRANSTGTWNLAQ